MFRSACEMKLLEARRVRPVGLHVAGVLARGAKTQVASPVVQRIAVSVIDQLAPYRAHDYTVHVLAPISAVGAFSLGDGVRPRIPPTSLP